MRIKDKSNCREMKLTLEIHLVMRIKDKSNCRDEVNAKKTSGHALKVMRIKDKSARNTSGHAY